MWTTTRKKLGLLLEEQELLRRAVDGLTFDMDELKKRVQRLIWRTRKEEAATETDAGAAADTVIALGDTASTAPDAPGHASKASWPSASDPVSARLLARRQRRGGPSREEPPSEGE